MSETCPTCGAPAHRERNAVYSSRLRYSYAPALDVTELETVDEIGRSLLRNLERLAASHDDINQVSVHISILWALYDQARTLLAAIPGDPKP